MDKELSLEELDMVQAGYPVLPQEEAEKESVEETNEKEETIEGENESEEEQNDEGTYSGTIRFEDASGKGVTSTFNNYSSS